MMTYILENNPQSVEQKGDEVFLREGKLKNLICLKTLWSHWKNYMILSECWMERVILKLFWN